MESAVKIHRGMAKLGGVELFYMDTETDGPAILCLHGRFGRAESWVDFIRHYGGRYRIVAPDQRGHGLSGRPVSTYSAKEMAGDMAELLDRLGIGQAVAVGHSMGGRVAGHLAALYPGRVKALAVLDKSASAPTRPAPPPPEEIPDEDPLTKGWPLPFASLQEAMERIRQETDTETSYQYFMNSLTETVDGYRMMFSSRAIAANIAYETSWFHLLPEIKCPVLLLRAKGNDAVSDEDFERMQSMIPACVAREIPNPDHNVHLSDKERFYRYFDEFLKKVL